jgi:hypothetical protein
MSVAEHTCWHRLRDAQYCKACRAQKRAEVSAYFEAVRLEEEQLRIARESLRCDPVGAGVAVSCAG